MIKHSCVYKGLINPIQISPAGESSNDERRKIPMEEFMKEYGGAVKRGAVIIAITVLIQRKAELLWSSSKQHSRISLQR